MKAMAPSLALLLVTGLGCGAKTPETAAGVLSGTVSGAVRQGVTVTLTGASISTTTSSAGRYAFSGLARGTYTVTPSLSGYSFDPPSRTVTLGGTDVSGQDFFASALTVVSGTVSGLVGQGVTMILSGAKSTTTTAYASGHYVFVGLTRGFYTVTPSLSGYEFDPPSRSVVLSGTDIGGQDFTASALPQVISGTVSGATSPGFTVTLTGAGFTTTTNGAGLYIFAGLANGTYIVTPSLPGYSFDPPSRTVTLSGTDTAAQDFTASVLPQVISGTISGAVSQGITVALTDTGTTTVTNGAGLYILAGLANGTHTVTPSLSGYCFDPPSRTVTLGGTDVGGQDFTASALPQVISGTVSGAVSQGVTVTLRGARWAETTTETSGRYAFVGLADGSYSITPSLAGYTFSPYSLALSLNGSDVGGQDFTAANARGVFQATGYMTSEREAHTVTLLPSGKVLVAGGIAGAVYTLRVLRSAELYDPATAMFSSTGSMTAARFGHTATLLPGGSVLLVSGGTAEIYDPAAGAFSATGNLTVVTGWHMATLLPSGKVLVTGEGTAELYDPATGTFTATGNMTAVRAGHSATLLLSGKVLVAASGAAELYDPATETFAATGNTTTARYGHTATLLPGGMVLLAGGSTRASQDLATAELYDPSTGTFAATGSMGVARYGHTATLLPGGMVLVAGGWTGASVPAATAELYDPSTGAFAATGWMPGGVAFHEATLLLSGKVLVTGGVTSSLGVVAPVDTASLYYP